MSSPSVVLGARGEEFLWDKVGTGQSNTPVQSRFQIIVPQSGCREGVIYGFTKAQTLRSRGGFSVRTHGPWASAPYCFFLPSRALKTSAKLPHMNYQFACSYFLLKFAQICLTNSPTRLHGPNNFWVGPNVGFC